LWNQLKVWRRVLEFLRDPYLLSRWAWVLGILFFGSIYIYMAVLFSFAYYGIARVSGVLYAWPDSLLTSIFLPFFRSDLPKILPVKLLAGIQCILVVTVGVGTIVKFLTRKLEAIRKAATELSDRFADQSIREKYIILEERFSRVASAPVAEDSGK
jgi:hypothetical protein